MVAMAVKEAKGQEHQQNFVKLLNSAMAACVFVVAPTKDHDQ
jgi:hypothetical protein